MIQIQLVRHNLDAAELLQIIIIAIYSFGIMLTVCELCQRINQAFAECSYVVDQLHWYLFPTKIQRMLPMILIFTQQPIEIKCFGSVACDRATFKSVSKEWSISNDLLLDLID